MIKRGKQAGLQQRLATRDSIYENSTLGHTGYSAQYIFTLGAVYLSFSNIFTTFMVVVFLDQPFILNFDIAVIY